MAELSGQVAVSGLGATRVPIRIATAAGETVELTTARQDGSWSVDIPPGSYVVHPRGLASYGVDVGGGMGTGYATSDTTNPESVDTARVSAALERRRSARKG